jgi:predicted transcriptional regulator
MSALPTNVVSFELPKKPRIKQKDAPPDQRKVSVLPIRAITDDKVTDNMLRVLACLCSYCNRAGLTWVSQKKLAEDMKVSRQAITKQLGKLTTAGYVEVVRKGFRGERSNTVRVIFDPTVDTATAIAVTNPIEDTRPPAIKQEQAMQAEEIDRAGQAKVAKLIAQAFKQPTKKERTMPKEGDSLTVKKMKEDIQKAKSKRSHKQPNTVANESALKVANEGSEKSLHRQPHRQPNEVAQNAENTVLESFKDDYVKDDLIINLKSNFLKEVQCNLSEVQIAELTNAGLTDTEIADGLQILLDAYKAEGLTAKPSQLIEGLMQMHRDAR